MIINEKSIIRIANILFIVLFVISLFALVTNKSFAKPNPYTIRSVSIEEMTGKAEGTILAIDKNEIKNDFKLHELNDSITLKIQFKNTDLKDYIIKSLVSNIDEYIEYDIKYDEDSLVKAGSTFDVLLTMTYKNNVDNLDLRDTNTPINVMVICDDDIPHEEEVNTPVVNNTTTTTKAITTTTEPTTTTSAIVVEDNNNNGINDIDSPRRDNGRKLELLNDNLSTSTVISSSREVFIILLLISIVGSAVCSVVITRDNKKQLLCVVCSIFVLSMFIPTIVNAEEEAFYGIVIKKPSIYNKLLVKYEDNGEIKEQIIDYDGTLNIPEPTKEGYRFGGWLNGDDWYDITQPITEDVELTPVLVPNIYTIEFNKNNKNATGSIPNQHVTYDNTVSLNNNNYALNGYIFEGWNTKADGTGIDYENNQKVINLATDGTVTLYAKWHKLTSSTLRNGSGINQFMKKLSGNTSTATNSVDKNIKEFKYVDNVPEEYKNKNYEANESSSTIKTYMWYKDGIIYYSSEADIIYLNKNSSYMFNILTALESVDVRFDTSNVTDMSQMFYKTEKLTNLDLTKFNTSKVTSMRSMFSEVYSMDKFDFSSFDTSKVTNFAFMFNQCYALTDLDLTDFDTSSAKDMNHMFSSTTGLKRLNVSSFDTSKVTNMQSMFHDMYSIEELDISNFNTSNVTNTTKMFFTDKELKTIYVSDLFTASKVSNNTQMFKDSTKLVGGNGTTYNSKNITKNYAHIDEDNNPGYLTRK